MDISVVMPVRNAVDRVQATIDSVLASVADTCRSTELILVDNASTDGTAEFVHARWGDRVRVVRVEAVGSSSAKNGGVEAALGRVLLFVDDDVQVPRNWVTTLAEPLLSGDADIVCGAVRLAANLDRPGMTDYHRGLLADTGDGLGSPPRTVVGASMGASRAVFEAGLSFHPSLGPGRSGFMEEHLWFLGARDRGFRTQFVDNATVDHHVSPERLDRAGWISRVTRQGRSDALTRILHGDTDLTIRDIARPVAGTARRCVYWIRDRKTVVPSERYLAAVCGQRAAIAFLRERRRVQ